MLKTRHTAPGFWMAGLGLFENAHSLFSDICEKNHLQSCIAQAKEVLHQLDCTPEPSQPTNSGTSLLLKFKTYIFIEMGSLI